MNKVIYSVFLLFLLTVCSCKKEPLHNSTGTIDPSVQFTANVFNDWYLWYGSIPPVDLTKIKTPDDYIAAVKYIKDKWSFTMSYTDMVNLFQNGVTTGWGFGWGLDSQNLLHVLYVYNNSAMGKAGVKRGWQIKAINGQLVSAMSVSVFKTVLTNASNSFDFIKNDGSESIIQLSKGTIGINGVLYSAIYPKGGKKIGYLVFNEFLGSSVKELNTVFSGFSGGGITDLILDLRYNGGGTLSCADSLVALLAGKQFHGQTYNTLIYSDKHTNSGYSSAIKLKSNSLQLDHLVVVTTSSTASASELVISGLKPYLNMKLIGSATYGKPVGMDVSQDTKLNIAVAPICFKNVNSQGYTDYYDGIPVDFAVPDNVTQDWGNVSDLSLTAALNYISTGTIGFVPAAKSAFMAEKMVYKGGDNPLENLFQFTK